MSLSEIVGYAVFSLSLIAVGIALSIHQPATFTGDDVLPWICFMTGFAILTLGSICFVAGTSLAALSLKSLVGFWLVLSLLLAFGLYVDWRLYYSSTDGLNEVVFEWAGSSSSTGLCPFSLDYSAEQPGEHASSSESTLAAYLSIAANLKNKPEAGALLAPTRRSS